MASKSADFKVRKGVVEQKTPGLPVSTIEIPSVQSVENWWSVLNQLAVASGVVVLRPSSSAEYDKDGYLYCSDFLAEVFEIVDSRPLMLICVCNGPIRSNMMMFPAMSSLVLATQGATFGFPEIQSDTISPSVTLAMKKRVTEAVQRRLMLVGDTIDAEEAQRFGLVDFVGDEETVENELARMIYKNCSPQVTYAMNKPDLLKAMMEEEEAEDK